MKNLKKISAKDISENPISLFSEKWSLITAGDENGYNTMTASWGGIGKLWNKDVCFIFVRPQRYTYEFIEANDLFTVSFYPEQWHSALVFCGANSGRDVNKAEKTGLTPLFIDSTTTFEQAKLTLVCRKLAYQDMDEKGFVDDSINNNYANKDYHRVYVGEIVACYEA